MAKRPWQSDLHWRRDGQQDRAHKTQSRVLDAAETLFFEQGYEATSVNNVAKRAKCSIGSVYHHFKDKKAIAFALFDRMMADFEATAKEAVAPERWEGASIIDILRGFVEFTLINNKDRPGFKTAALEAVRLDPALAGSFPKQQRQLNRALQSLILARRTEIGHPDPEFASGYALDLLIALLRARRDPDLQQSQLSKLSDKQFTEQVLALAASFLRLQNTGKD